MKHFFPIALLGALLLLAPVTFTACESPQEEVDINLISDFRGLAEAIKEGSQSLSEKLSLIEAAVSGGFADAEAAQQLLEQAVSSLGGSVAKKLVAIETAVKSQTLSLETKLGLIEAAVAAGFADSAAAQALLSAAVSSLSGTAEEKLAVIEGAVSSQTTSLSSKLSLIETAVKEGLADRRTGQSLLSLALNALGGTVAEQLAAIDQAVQEQSLRLMASLDLIDAALEYRLADVQEALSLIQQAVEALSGTAEENLAALEEAVQSQLAGLSSKLALIEAAVAGGFADEAAQQELLQQAVVTLSGTLEERLAAIETAVKGQTSALSTKLGLIETAVTSGLADGKAGQELIKEAIATLNGTAEGKLEAIVTALNDQTTGFAAKLDLIQTAVAEGFAANLSEMALIDAALASLTGTTEEKLGDIATAMESQTTSLATKLEAIQEAFADSLANANEALRLIQTSLESLNESIADNLVAKLTALNTSLSGNVVGVLTQIFTAIGNQKDYSEILEAIAQAIEDLDIPLDIEFKDFVSDGELIMGTDTLLRIPFMLPSADIVVKASASAGIAVTVEQSPDNPLEGNLAILATTIDGSSQVELTLSSRFRSETCRLKIVKAQLTAGPGLEQTVVYSGSRIVEFRYSTNTSTIVSVPDTATWFHRKPYVGENSSDSVLHFSVDPNKGFDNRKTGVTVISRVSKDTLKFIINQLYNTERIDFKDPALKTYLLTKIDYNHNGSIEKVEAAAVTSLEEVFGNALKNGASYTSFNEFQYFTGIEDYEHARAIADGYFNHWTKLEEITFPENLTSIKSGNGDEAGILTDCPRLTTIQGKFSVSGRAVVYNNTLLAVATGDDTSYSIPDGVTRLGSRSVYGVKELGVPASVNKITNSAFADTSTVNRDTLFVYFKGDTPPQCEDHPLGSPGGKSCSPVKVFVPAVIRDGSVDVVETNARIEQFRAAFGNDADLMKFAYYTEWPLVEGISITATIARKQGYVCDSDANYNVQSEWLPNEHIAVLYQVGGVNKRADARIVSVNESGVAKIRFVVDYETPDNTACTLVYPPSAAYDDNSGVKDMFDMKYSHYQDGTLAGCTDVQVGTGSIQTTTPGLSVSAALSPIYSIFRFHLDKSFRSIVVSSGGVGLYGFSRSEDIDVCYFALSGSPEDRNYSINGEKDGRQYIGSVLANFPAGKCVLIEVTMSINIDDWWD